MDFVPFDDREGHIWMNGAFCAWRDAKVHLLTHSLHYGSAVFEGERAYGGEIFRSMDHARRLVGSARILDYEIPYSAEAIDQAKREVLAKSGLGDAYVRAIAWRGSEKMGLSAKDNTIHLAIAAWAWGDYFEDKMAGIRLAMADWKRPSPETAPHDAKAAGLYMICTMSKHAAERAGYADALMLDYRGLVAEATGANVFFQRDGALHTPTPDCFLNGLTRQTVIALARARGIEVVERQIHPDELASFQECFITGSAAEITPVREIAGQSYRPGVLTETLMEDYTRATRGAIPVPA
ncbi:MAG: branched-chain amino acid aminotransferase [Pseudomonadota bacterium]